MGNKRNRSQTKKRNKMSKSRRAYMEKKKMIEIEKFINCVRVNPQLWDNTHTDYMNRTVREEHWINVGKIIFPNWNQITSDERQDRMTEMKGKWRTLRDNYVRCKNSNSQTNPRKKKKYVYSEELKFLENYVPNRRRNNLDNDDEDEEEEEEDVKINIELQKVQKFEEVLLETDNTYDENEAMQAAAVSPPHESFEKESRRPMQQRAPIKRKVITGQQPAYVRRQRECLTDSDKAFVFSILPDIKKLSYEQKLDFRMYTLGFFKRANAQNSQSSFNGKH